MATPLLDRLAEMQNRPFGTNTALSDGSQYGAGGSAGSQFRRQASAYGQALRILNRAARRGDANAALRAIAVREDAMNKGYSPGGVSRKTEADAGILGRLDAMRSSAADRQRAAELERQRAELEMQGLGQGQGQGQGQGFMGGSVPVSRPAAGFMGGSTGVQGATGVEGARGLGGGWMEDKGFTGGSPKDFGAKGLGGGWMEDKGFAGASPKDFGAKGLYADVKPTVSSGTPRRRKSILARIAEKGRTVVDDIRRDLYR